MSPTSRGGPAAYLASRIRLGMKFGLETMHALVEALGHPERRFPVLLVAGTNGKGSVVAYAAAALRASGLVAGRYISPHLVRVNERIAVGGREIGDRALWSAVAEVREAAESLARAGALPAQPTYFEVLTAAAFVHFAARSVDVAVLEVGMGGRLDATNVTAPAVSAIVTVERDHEAYLGTTLGAIAGEKAGVLRPGRVTVLGPMSPEAVAAVAAVAAERGARLAHADAEVEVRERPRGRVDLRTRRHLYRALRPLPGAHQRDNLAVAVRLLEEAQAAGVGLDLEAVAAGVDRTRWPGRLQRLPGRPSLLVDGAHNPAAARALAAELRDGPPFVLVFGAMADKDVAAMGRALFPLARLVVLTRVPDARAASPDEIVRRVGRAAAAARSAPTVGAAIARARRLAGAR
ncbi:MAG TPA: cyanophycin synthetase, partial [Vicinamibacteria bacterium]|nr:cyanophycin synthetase [Vicinamibacteria bacterium]